MNGLLIGAGALLALVVGALLEGLLRRPKGMAAARMDYDLAVYKDQLNELDSDFERGQIGEAEAKAAKAEIERRILALSDGDAGGTAPAADGGKSGRWFATATVGLGVPALSIGLYFQLGTPEYPNVPHAGRDLAAERQAEQRHAQAGEMSSLAAKLVERLAQDPGNLKGWLLLGRTYLTLEREADALKALRRALALAPEDADVMVELAEALVITNARKVGTEAHQLFEKALSLDARRPRPRFYLALADAQDGKTREALQGWVDMLAVSPADAPWRPTVVESINKAARELKIDPAGVQPSLAAKLLGPPKTEATTAPQPETPPAAAATPSAAPGPTREQMEAAQEMSAGDRQAMIRSMVQRLADRLKEEPDDLAGWQRLANAYRVLGETEKAKEADAQIKRLTR
ncbi:MAG: c-type cytochrome biogenesis protein CcmI [Rhodospirillaceae bacterium]